MIIKYLGDYNDLVEELKYDVHLIGMVIEFIKLKLDDYVSYKQKIDKTNEIRDNKKLIEMSHEERIDLFMFTLIDSNLCGGYMAEMLCVHIYTIAEEYLNKICTLLVTEREINNILKKERCSNIMAYKLVLDSKNIKNSNSKYFQELDVLRKIRNAIIHNRGELSEKDVNLVSKYVSVDDINNVCVGIDDANRFLVFFEVYMSNIFQEINLIIKNS
ncbi:hypothetical protein PM004_08790 [Clostridium paraputrificum]|mgnify:CR=1 FL=1|uniref:Uncharacterized protein n=1 Tax=Myoviridae sp. ct6F13 TaxID=2827602 RepID=A0A8S5LJP3_9CAUD|nr:MULTISPECIES: hypothetical protein [Clostridium]DAD70048.1 MAG TPA: hypothetical protein [Myoviridae sp. ct6F13]MBS7132216.1 hypothetical protein [Clostridium sp.]MDB2089433.1 hypothetical protein [Clostridium paraputrificum]MDB2096369.1 hypothetical protein [Clostridium paraputrificum]MDB2098142.1 hypothetical protein [Clostridium paraputrificum]